MSYRDLKTIQYEISHSLDVIHGLTKKKSGLSLGAIIFEVDVHMVKLKRLNAEKKSYMTKPKQDSE